MNGNDALDRAVERAINDPGNQATGTLDVKSAVEIVIPLLLELVKGLPWPLRIAAGAIIRLLRDVVNSL